MLDEAREVARGEEDQQPRNGAEQQPDRQDLTILRTERIDERQDRREVARPAMPQVVEHCRKLHIVVALDDLDLDVEDSLHLSICTCCAAARDSQLTPFSRCWSTPATRSATGTPTTTVRSGSRGYQLVDRYLRRDPPELSARGLHIASVAGARRHHADAIETDAAAPGRPLELRRDPDNEHDPNAVAVHGGDRQQVGWVPRELAAELASKLDAGKPWTAIVLRAQRRSPRDPRHGLTMLPAPDEAIGLRTA